jgi:hypothetical protein
MAASEQQKFKFRWRISDDELWGINFGCRPTAVIGLAAPYRPVVHAICSEPVIALGEMRIRAP